MHFDRSCLVLLTSLHDKKLRNNHIQNDYLFLGLGSAIFLFDNASLKVVFGHLFLCSTYSVGRRKTDHEQ